MNPNHELLADELRRIADLIDPPQPKEETRWWCRQNNEFGPIGERHPYCDPNSYTHTKCGWGKWSPLP